VTPSPLRSLDAEVAETPRRIFVFGSNLEGVHGAGSAREAREKHGAQWGIGVGPTGSAYAIPTKATPRGPVLTLDEIRRHVIHFKLYAEMSDMLVFDVVKIGCGLAGYTDAQIAPLFAGSPDNVNLPHGWRAALETR
jgi:hypothetical protein